MSCGMCHTRSGGISGGTRSEGTRSKRHHEVQGHGDTSRCTRSWGHLKVYKVMGAPQGVQGHGGTSRCTRSWGHLKVYKVRKGVCLRGFRRGKGDNNIIVNMTCSIKYQYLFIS